MISRQFFLLFSSNMDTKTKTFERKFDEYALQESIPLHVIRSKQYKLIPTNV